MRKARALQPGQGAGQVGPVISRESRDRIISYIDEAERGGARILVDGRTWKDAAPRGHWVGPTVILHASKGDRALHDEIFGPVLSVLEVDTAEEALAIENACPYGNAACIYPSSGGSAEYFQRRFRAGMIGVNIGVPVPREPFSFGGMETTLSKYGDCDITGEAFLRFVTRTRKVTTQWSLALNDDAASFVSRM